MIEAVGSMVSGTVKDEALCWHVTVVTFATPDSTVRRGRLAPANFTSRPCLGSLNGPHCPQYQLAVRFYSIPNSTPSQPLQKPTKHGIFLQGSKTTCTSGRLLNTPTATCFLTDGPAVRPKTIDTTCNETLTVELAEYDAYQQLRLGAKSIYQTFRRHPSRTFPTPKLSCPNPSRSLPRTSSFQKRVKWTRRRQWTQQ